MYTFIQPQKKIAEEKIEIRLATEVVQALRDYCEFLDSPQGLHRNRGAEESFPQRSRVWRLA